ncbi:MAG: PepSY domain-containing protein [Chitinophagaceae bacterium]|nr:PepSY domain-containing protein [Chitinophagaceae bacterium]MCW5925809.1 PepSY domain-containing protein [Chitinophagaceae bacterium]
MIVSIWRYAHLALAVISSLFLVILSVTGVILAFDAIDEKIPAYKTDEFNTLDLAQSVSGLRKVYPEIIELSVDHNRFVSIDALDEGGNNVRAYIHPVTGAVLGPVQPKSQFIQWITALHRSLFLKDTGRIIVGVVSFLLLLISVSGVILIIKRQQGIRHFFARINRDFFAQYFHVVSGRWLLIPVFIVALTGTYLFMVRMNLVKKNNQEIVHAPEPAEPVARDVKDFTVFQQTKLSEVEKLEFPFDADDPDEHYVLKLKDRILSVNQVSGDIMEEIRYPYAVLMERLSLDLHTGRTSIIWAIVLGIASLNILVFMYTGFVITFRRTRTKIRNKYKPSQAEIVLLAGTENGSTLFFANQIHKQLLADGQRSFLAGMNQYQAYGQARHILVFTSTYGLGTAPTNAVNFEKLVQKYPQLQPVQFSVVGFGSKAYPDFCAYARHIDKVLEQQSWAVRFLPLHTIHDRSTDEFITWVRHWSEKALMALAATPAVYRTKVPALKKLKVVSKTLVTDSNSTFTILLKPVSKLRFQSGDLLTIYPANDNRERFYSIGKNEDTIQLVVKLHPGGFGSGFLYGLEENSIMQARVMANPHFYFPEKAPAVALIANGTGIAPFLGMIKNNRKNIPVHLYAGFRYNNELAQQYRQFALEEKANNTLAGFDFAFSRELDACYVMDLIRRDQFFFVSLLNSNGVIMICGSLKMQQDVERVLEEVLMTGGHRQLSHYKEKNQILTDCY